jgi:multiple sugar transport system ATP-binding protein
VAAISIRALRKDYGDTPVLRGIDLEIRDGEFVVLVGPSGCGKSTLLRLIAGLEEITSGEIRIGERIINELAPKDRDLAMVFQSYALYPHMSVRENMSFSLKLRRLSTAQINAAVSAASEKLGLQSLMDRLPRALSGGQRQRVAMGRAIVREPKAFLFDEPLSNLDARLREQMRYEIRRLQRDLGTTSIYVTHDQVEAMTMADRIVAMNDGLAQQIGSPTELYDDPNNIFVAGFIGSPAINFLDATLVDGSGTAVVMVGAEKLGVVPIPSGLPPDRKVTVGLRPERIIIGAAAHGANAQIDLLEPMGLGTVIHLSLSGQSVKLFTTDRSPLKGCESVGLLMQPADIFLFDPHSGLRLRPPK